MKKLSKKQLFDLRFKYSNIKPLTIRSKNIKNGEWWRYKKYWDDLCAFSTLPEDFIREYIDVVNWRFISIRQDLSEDFIREFQDKVDWKIISECCILSEDFIREMKDKIKWKYAYTINFISREFRREMREEGYIPSGD